MSQNSVPQKLGQGISNAVNNTSAMVQNPSAQTFGNSLDSTAPFVNPLYDLGRTIYHNLQPAKAQTQNPAAAGAPPTQGQVTSDALDQQVQKEQQMKSSGTFLGGSPAGLDSAPQTSSLTLLGS